MSRHPGLGRVSGTSVVQRGYVLVMVLGVLVLLALVAGRLASRVDLQRSVSAPFLDEASAEAESTSALSLALYWLMTKPLNANGVGDVLKSNWIADGRWYALSDRVSVSLQDERGLVSVNHPESPMLRRLIEGQGVDPRRVDQLLDVLADYIDTDDLKRLNGAERREYRALDIDGPRNDLLRSLNELSQLPLWRDEPDLCRRLTPFLSVRVSGLLNPNTAPMTVLRALAPGASSQQLELLDTLRKTSPFTTGERATVATGLPLTSDEYMFHTSNELRLTIWVAGQPRAREYNLKLEPGGLRAPWQITGFQTVVRPNFLKASRPPFESSLSVLIPPVSQHQR